MTRLSICGDIPALPQYALMECSAVKRMIRFMAWGQAQGCTYGYDDSITLGV